VNLPYSPLYPSTPRGLETRGLTPKQCRFVAEYLVDLNGTQAAIRAGYSRKTANEQAARLLAKASVKEAVAAGQARHLAKADISAERVLEEVRRIAFSSIAELFDANGNLKPMQHLTPDQAAPIKVFEHRNLTAANGASVSILRIRLWDKVRALEMLMKYLGLLPEKIDLGGPITVRWKDHTQA
jgi:phage terminase small subunit